MERANINPKAISSQEIYLYGKKEKPKKQAEELNRYCQANLRLHFFDNQTERLPYATLSLEDGLAIFNEEKFKAQFYPNCSDASYIKPFFAALHEMDYSIIVYNASSARKLIVWLAGKPLQSYYDGRKQNPILFSCFPEAADFEGVQKAFRASGQSAFFSQPQAQPSMKIREAKREIGEKSSASKSL